MFSFNALVIKLSVSNAYTRIRKQLFLIVLLIFNFTIKSYNRNYNFIFLDQNCII